MQEQDGILGFLYQNSLGPMPAAKAPTDLPPSKVFRGIGIASLHTSLLDSREDVHFLFKSSPFGTQSHGHNPHNTFQLNAYGEALLTTCVYRDLHGSKFHYQWAHSTKAHNGVLVDGEGQIPHTPAPHGHITDFQLTPRYDYLVGDAAPAYGGRLERYQRHVAFVKTPAPVLVLWDDLEAKAPATYQFMLHALAPFEVDEARAALAVEQPKAGVTAKYFAPGPLRFRQWDGYQPPPDKPFPNQWHLEAGTAEPSRHMALLTAIVPHRAGHWADWSGERMETETAVGVRLIWNNQPIEVAFRKPGVRGPAQWRGQPFGGPVLVR
jgi:hypothetical protein